MKKVTWTGLLVATLSLVGCKTEHTIRIEPIEVKPITLNINIRVEKELDDFFDFEKTMATTATNQGASK